MNPGSRYINLLAKSVMNEIYGEIPTATSEDVATCRRIINDLELRNSRVFEEYPYLRDPERFAQIISYTRRNRHLHTYVKRPGVENVIECCEHAIREGIKGGFMEIGTLRGGIGILMNGIALIRDDPRSIFVADSFQGLPTASASDSLFDREVWSHYAAQLKDHMFDCKCSLEDVQANFQIYDLLTDNVIFMPGWVENTLLDFTEPLAVVRLDVDWYEATKFSLECVYANIAPGGFVIIDDYNLIGCKKAVDDFRAAGSISDELVTVDVSAGVVYWRKQ